jgi:hypothetical protein
MIRSFGSVVHQSWVLPALLVAISAISSWEFACITPFAAFAVIAAYALPTGAALCTVAGVWLANQAVGFAVLGYPWTLDTALWGIAIGAAALLAVVVASAMLRLEIRNNVVAVGTAFVAALGAYEGSLSLVTFAVGGRNAFTPAIITHVALLNFGWPAALVGTYAILRYTGTISGARTVSPAFPHSQ